MEHLLKQLFVATDKCQPVLTVRKVRVRMNEIKLFEEKGIETLNRWIMHRERPIVHEHIDAVFLNFGLEDISVVSHSQLLRGIEYVPFVKTLIGQLIDALN
jgi:hypothetical protein